MSGRENLKNSEIYILVFLASFVVYLITRYPAVTWWQNAAYGIACSDLGVNDPPGSVITTFLGWPFMKLAGTSHPIAALNILAGFIASLIIVLTAKIAVKVKLVADSTETERNLVSPAKWTVFGAGLGCLILAFDPTFWLHGTKYTAYIVTALFTVFILLAILKWWQKADEKSGIRWLFLILLLFGLDFSVHRTNLLLLPGFLIAVDSRRPRTFKEIKYWLAGAGGLILGLAFHLLIIPMAAARPFINSNDAANLSRFWDYVSLKQMGGGFLINLYPRKAPLFTYQAVDYFKANGSGFFHWSGSLGIIGILPGILGIYGLIRMLKKNTRLALALTALWLAFSIGAIVYFNIPENFFRSMWRHYLPGLVILTVFVAYGAAEMVQLVRIKSTRSKNIAMVLVIIILLALPLNNLLSYYETCDASADFYAHDYASNIMASLPLDAVLFTFGDNDTYPLWYLQAAENVRPDVTVINLPLTNTDWIMRQIIERHPDFNLDISPKELQSWGPRRWQDTVITVAVETHTEDLFLPDSIILPPAVDLQIKPSIADHCIMGQEYLVLKLVESFKWQRPIYFSTGGVQYLPDWIGDRLRHEGFAFRLLPITDPLLNTDILKINLFEKYTCRGFDRPDRVLLQPYGGNGIVYLSALVQLGMAFAEENNSEGIARVNHFIEDNFAWKDMTALPRSHQQAIEYLISMEREVPPITDGN